MTVNLEWNVHWCARHLEPFRSRWPAGAATAMLLLFNASVAREEIVRHAGGRADSLDAVLREFSPLCCFLGDAVMQDLTTKALDPGAKAFPPAIAIRFRP